MQPNPVLIVTNMHDEHADHVIGVMNERGVPVFRLNTEDFPREVSLAWRDEIATLSYHGRELKSDAVRSAWYRRPSEAEPHAEITDAGVRQVVIDECWYVTQGLYRCLDHILWVSNPDALARSKYKPHQLHLARTLGFDVPPTLFTNDPDAFRAFYADHGGRVIVKIAGRGPTTIPADKVVFTNLVDEARLARADGIRFAPHLFQAYVEKAYEVRVTIIGRKIFAVKIDSQATECTQIDWRHYDLEHTPHSAIELPTAVAARCMGMLDAYGLAFGASDLIVTPDGRWVFLEINPNGQWLWMEEMTGLPMTDALIELLTNPKD